uniref:Uncharacterized protein n=1 Tax=uncultured bacterium contig00031 TaxID=1181520 RepID=A0A806K0U6_9BACT|nr:hypothetical protein [uncultured bacterium contig00031]
MFSPAQIGEMVRKIYADLHKTADYRARLDIEKYAIQSA